MADDSEADAPESTQSAAPEDGTPGVERLLTLSDGVVAIALTLLVLQLAVPTIEGVSGSQAQSPGYLWKQLSSGRGDQFTAYVVSFYVIAQFWLTHHRVFRSIQGHVEGLAWWNFAFLFTITLMPFSTRLLATFMYYRTAVIIYWLNILAPGVLLYASWKYATRHDMIRADTPPEIRVAICRRVFWAQAFYALGVALCVFGSLWSIAFIFALQLNYAVAPRLPGRRKEAAISL